MIQAENLKYTKLDNEIPLMFGSSLFSKVNHECNKKKYWELDHVKGIPLLFAIEDFHEDASMMWTFNGVISILYGIDQNIMNDESGRIVLNTTNGKIFVKDGKNGKVEIAPLFFNNSYPIYGQKPVAERSAGEYCRHHDVHPSGTGDYRFSLHFVLNRCNLLVNERFNFEHREPPPRNL